MTRKRGVFGDAVMVVGLAAAAGAYILSVAVTGSYLPPGPVAFGEEVAAMQVVDSRAVMLHGADVGEVVMGETVLLRIRTAAGGYSSAQRAVIVADRLQQIIGSGVQPGEVYAGMVDGSAAVLAGGELIVTADRAHARINGTTPGQLATTWASNIASALGGEPGESQLSVSVWRPTEPYGDKDVPIISLGRGIRVGVARVSGPESKLGLVKAVAQIESRLARFGDVEIYVPISTEVPGKTIDRINECAVVGLADLKL